MVPYKFVGPVPTITKNKTYKKTTFILYIIDGSVAGRSSITGKGRLMAKWSVWNYFVIFVGRQECNVHS